LAKALMSDPSVLILDEPTTGLDPNQIIEIRNVIKTISHEKTVILSTHIMQEVEALCDKLVIIHRGKLVADDSLAHLQRKSSNQLGLSVQFDGPIDPDLFRLLKGIISLEVKSDHQLIITSESERLRQEVLAVITEHNLPLITIKNVGGSLEEIFQKLTTEEGEAGL
jgi:ABC-2 type transport system ATP-binding protein